MKPLAIVLGFGLLAAVFAGCVTPSSTTPAPATDPAGEGAVPALPNVSAQGVYDVLKKFSTSFPKRNLGNDAHKKARDFLAGEMEAAGLEVIRQEFDITNSPLATPTGANTKYKGENIIGIKWGTERDRWVVVGSHYDVTDGAVYGAYDDGSGTIMTLELAKAFATVNTTRTLAFIPFDAEEQGLVGSEFFVKSVQEGTFQYPNVTVEAMIDLDMIGINWPADPAIIAWENSPELKNLSETLRVEQGVPDTHMKYRKPKGGSSDGAAFIAADIPTIYYWSNWDEMRYSGADVPGFYPFWHQADTVEGMDQLAGGHDKLVKGMQVVLNVVTGILVKLAHDPEFAPTAVSA